MLIVLGRYYLVAPSADNRRKLSFSSVVLMPLP